MWWQCVALTVHTPTICSLQRCPSLASTAALILRHLDVEPLAHRLLITYGAGRGRA
jgi:hypothetical protein